MAPPPSAPRNAGTLAHLAMGAWLESRGWLEGGPGEALQSAWDIEAARWGVDPRRLEDSVLTRSRLRRRGAELASLLKSSGSHARSEVLLCDYARRMYGQLDIVVDGAGGAVVDLKSGQEGTPEITNDVRNQLLLYAHLYERQYGHLPASLFVFSLRHGALPVEFSPHDIDALLSEVDAARGAVPLVAAPDPSGCRYCRRRLQCEPHWGAAAAWNDPDCVEGRIVKVETSRAGLTAVRLETTRGAQWVAGLIVVNDEELALGRLLRITEVAGGDHGEERVWRATRFTRTLVVRHEM